jgi:hypothetical protein
MTVGVGVSVGFRVGVAVGGIWVGEVQETRIIKENISMKK